jgi:hypothetical protein
LSQEELDLQAHIVRYAKAKGIANADTYQWVVTGKLGNTTVAYDL